MGLKFYGMGPGRELLPNLVGLYNAAFVNARLIWYAKLMPYNFDTPILTQGHKYFWVKGTFRY